MEKKKLLWEKYKWYLLIKVPILIYLAISLSIVPTINAVPQEVIQGAHRGNSIDFEENTLDAFKSALESDKYTFIEFDVQYSKDNKIVVFHQNDQYHIPKQWVEISELNYNELQSYFKFKIPQYHEVMDLVNNQKPLDIEIKSHGDFEKDKQLVDFVIADCENRNCDKIILTSPSEEVIEYIEEKYPKINTRRVFWIHPFSILPLETTTTWFYESTQADYMIMHGYNIKNYNLLLKCKPKDKGIMFWYYTDEIYIAENPENCGSFWIEQTPQVSIDLEQA